MTRKSNYLILALNQVAKQDRLNLGFYAGCMCYESNIERCKSCFNKWTRYRKLLNEEEKAILDRATDKLYAKSEAMYQLWKKQHENKKRT